MSNVTIKSLANNGDNTNIVYAISHNDCENTFTTELELIRTGKTWCAYISANSDDVKSAKHAAKELADNLRRLADAISGHNFGKINLENYGEE